jgi:hypothetical protein
VLLGGLMEETKEDGLPDPSGEYFVHKFSFEFLFIF